MVGVQLDGVNYYTIVLGPMLGLDEVGWLGKVTSRWMVPCGGGSDLETIKGGEMGDVALIITDLTVANMEGPS